MNTPNTQRRLRACVYTRISGDSGGEKYSLGEQEEACRQYCAAHGYDVVTVISDVHSGYDFKRRRGIQQVMELMAQQAIDALVIWRFDRLTRRIYDLPKIAEPAEQHRVALVSITQGIDTSNALGKHMLLTVISMAESEREAIRERMQLGKRGRVRAGKPLHGRRPLYGYAWVDDLTDPSHPKRKARYVVNEAEAAIVRRIFHEMATGRSLRSITRGLDADGVPVPIPSATGTNQWQVSTVQRICKQPAYWGEAKAYRYRAVEKHKVNARNEVIWYKTREFRPADETVALSDAAIPPLVSPELAAAVNERLTINKIEAARNHLASDPTKTLLRGGLARCGYCGATFVVSSRHTAKHGGGPAYRCGRKMHDLPGCGHHTIGASVLDTAVWQHVTRILLRPDIIAAEVEKRRSAPDPTREDLERVDRQLNKIRSQQANLTRLAAMVSNPDDLEPLAAQLNQLGSVQRQLESERARVALEQQAWQQVRGRLDSLEAWCHLVADRLNELTYDEKRDALRALGVAVTVYRRDHTPRFVVEMQVPLDGFEPMRITDQQTEQRRDGGRDLQVVSSIKTSLRQGVPSHSLTLRWTDAELLAPTAEEDVVAAYT